VHCRSYRQRRTRVWLFGTAADRQPVSANGWHQTFPVQATALQCGFAGLAGAFCGTFARNSGSGRQRTAGSRALSGTWPRVDRSRSLVESLEAGWAATVRCNASV